MKFSIITRYYHPTPDGIGHHSGYIHQYLINLGLSVQVIYDAGIISLQPIYKKSTFKRQQHFVQLFTKPILEKKNL